MMRTALLPALARAAAACSSSGNSAAASIVVPSTAALDQQTRRYAAADGSAGAASSSSSIVGCCVLERLPIVCPPDATYVQEYKAWSAGLAAKYWKGYPDELAEHSSQQTEQEKGAEPSTRAADIEAAENGDPRSPWRRLDQRIFLLVKAPASGGGAGGGGAGSAAGAWQFPAAVNSGDETIRQTAERALAGAMRPGPKVYFVGNSPAGHCAADGGSTLFFHRAQLIKGDLALRPGAAEDYAWVAKDELEAYLGDRPAVHSLLQKML